MEGRKRRIAQPHPAVCGKLKAWIAVRARPVEGEQFYRVVGSNRAAIAHTPLRVRIHQQHRPAAIEERLGQR